MKSAPVLLALLLALAAAVSGHSPANQGQMCHPNPHNCQHCSKLYFCADCVQDADNCCYRSELEFRASEQGLTDKVIFLINKLCTRPLAPAKTITEHCAVQMKQSPFPVHRPFFAEDPQTTPSAAPLDVGHSADDLDQDDHDDEDEQEEIRNAAGAARLSADDDETSQSSISFTSTAQTSSVSSSVEESTASTVTAMASAEDQTQSTDSSTAAEMTSENVSTATTTLLPTSTVTMMASVEDQTQSSTESSTSITSTVAATENMSTSTSMDSTTLPTSTATATMMASVEDQTSTESSTLITSTQDASIATSTRQMTISGRTSMVNGNEVPTNADDNRTFTSMTQPSEGGDESTTVSMATEKETETEETEMTGTDETTVTAVPSAKMSDSCRSTCVMSKNAQSCVKCVLDHRMCCFGLQTGLPEHEKNQYAEAKSLCFV